jgi:hypothetical protein
VDVTTRYIARDLRTNELLRELPLTGVTWGHRLNAAGSLRARLALPGGTSDDARTTARALLGALQEARTALYVIRDGAFVWGGILWEAPFDSETGVIDIRADDFLSWLAVREIRWDADYAGTDQLTIPQELVTEAQARSGGDIGITVGNETSGVLRDATWWSYQAVSLSSAIEQLAKARDGFDYAIDISSSGGMPTKTLRLHYPRRGRRAGQTGLVFDYDRRNITRVQVRTVRPTNSWFVAGIGEGDLMESTVVTDTAALDAGYPLLDGTFTDKTIDDPALLEQIARERLRVSAFPTPLLTITTLGDVDPVIGAYITGDEARVIIPPGKVARFPDGFDAYQRIVAFDVRPPDGGGAEVVAVTFSDPL